MKTTTAILAVWALFAVAFLRQQYQHEAEIAVLNEALANSPQALTVTATAYTASQDECDGDPTVGARGTKVKAGRTLAFSQDIYKHLVGKKVWVEGIGVRVVEDSMHRRWRNKCDVLVGTKSEAREFGVQQKKVVVL